MTLGFENRKQLGFLCVLALVLAYLLYTNVFSSPVSAPSRPAAAAPVAEVPVLEPTPAPAIVPSVVAKNPKRPIVTSRAARTEGFHPVFRAKRPEDRPDVTKIDPTLRLELLAKIEGQNAAGSGRNLFQFGAPPPPPAPKALPKQPEPIIRPVSQQPVNVTPAPPPPPPPPPYKFYGYSMSRASGRNTAFFMDGDVSVLVAEGDLIKKRYKVLRISKKSVLLEDVEGKRQHTLRISDEANGG